MFLSEENKFLFIHIPRTGGTAVYHAITTLQGISGRERLFNDYHNRLGGAHQTARRLKFQISRHFSFEWFNIFKFAFLRNPYEWAVSVWQKEMTQPHNEDMEFGEFIEKRMKTWQAPQTSYILDEAGEPMVDFIGDTAHLQRDWNKICKKLNFEPVKLHAINQTRHRPYREYYTPEIRKRIEEIYADDIKFLESGF